ncbi:HTH domain-containing protein [Bombilactobacillus folatiphilus]|uniref:HTH domain-containing protein n=1 Tax=Bombilactobacillus folatiphilus TaxID=2923362 RepID=A0ABY4P708_9LACO|nr:HTH domain-containing protein [Bombilactobacillus folatiphilus]UQS81447.1 HTH domain-containing protein [Bombilactobacillus folatiphilus]
MVIFTERQKKILGLLLQTKKGLSLTKFEHQLNVSSRTLYREFSDLRLYLENQGIQLINDHGFYRLEGNSVSLLQIQTNIQHQNPQDTLSANSRQKALATMLLLNSEEIKMIDLALNLEVSLGTIQRDLNKVETTFKQYDLHLERKKGVGIVLSGREDVRRYLFCHLVADSVNEYQFLAYLQGQRTTVTNFSAVLLPVKLLRQCYRVLKTKVLGQIKEISDQQSIFLVLIFAMSLYRISKKCILSSQENAQVQIKYLNIIDQFLLSWPSQTLVKNLQSAERNFLALQLQNSDHQIKSHYLDYNDLSVSMKVKKLIVLVSMDYHWDFTHDAIFFEKLTLHVENLVQKKQPQLPKMKFMALETIGQQYQKLSQIIAKRWQEIFPQQKINPAEIQLLLLYFTNEYENYGNYYATKVLIACENGFSTAQILKNRLHQEIPDIQQIDTIKIAQLSQIHPTEYDLLLTTIDLPGFTGKYQIVSPLLLDSDVEEIKQHLKKNHSQARHEAVFDSSKTDHALQNLANKQLEITLYQQITTQFKVVKLLNKPQNNLEQLIHQLLRSLPDTIIENGTQVASNLIKRIELAPIGLPNTHLALLHTSSAGVLQLAIKVVELQWPVTMLAMDHEEIQVSRFLLMLAPADIDALETKLLGMISSLLVMNDANLHLFETGNTLALQNFLADKFLQKLQANNLS